MKFFKKKKELGYGDLLFPGLPETVEEIKEMQMRRALAENLSFMSYAMDFAQEFVSYWSEHIDELKS